MRATRQRIRAVFYAVLARDSGGTVTVSAGVEFVVEIVVFRCGKMKTDFQHFLFTWEQRKNTRHIFQNMSDLI
jgi:hypothetical protein